MGIETRVGFFVLAGLGVLVAFVLALADIGIGGGDDFYVDYGYAGTLQVGAPVRISGIKVGRVSDLRILNEDTVPPPALSERDKARGTKPTIRVRLIVRERSDNLFSKDSEFAIATQGVIGESYIEFTPGQGDGFILPGTAIRGIDAPRLDQAARQIAAVIESLDALIGVQEHQHLADLGKAMHSLITMINRVLEGREKQLGESFDAVHGLTKDFRAIVGVLHNEIVVHKGIGQMLRDGQVVLEIMRKDVPSILSKLDRTLASMEQLTQRGSKILESEGSAALMSDITTSVEHLKSASKDMKTMMGSLKKGEGTLGALIRDDELFKDLRYVVKELKERPWKLLWRE